MSLSEDEAEERLAALRRQREALDREIADLVLYLELGRRLHAGGVRTPPAPSAPIPAPAPVRATPFDPRGAIPGPGAGPGRPSHAGTRAEDRTADPFPPWDGFGGPREAWAADAMPARPAPVGEAAAGETASRGRRPPAPEPVAFAEDPTGARRYGRALVEAACEAIARAERPLHAREIHDALIARGFVIPGRDPVAALNTRLWKRAGEGGPLRRHGEAVYGLPEE